MSRQKRRVQVRINPTPFILVAFLTVVGALLGSWLIGLAVALGIVLLAEFAS